MKLAIVNSNTGEVTEVSVANSDKAFELAEEHGESVDWEGFDYIFTDAEGEKWVIEAGCWAPIDSSYLAE